MGPDLTALCIQGGGDFNQLADQTLFGRLSDSKLHQIMLLTICLEEAPHGWLPTHRISGADSDSMGYLLRVSTQVGWLETYRSGPGEARHVDDLSLAFFQIGQACLGHHEGRLKVAVQHPLQVLHRACVDALDALSAHHIQL